MLPSKGQYAIGGIVLIIVGIIAFIFGIMSYTMYIPFFSDFFFGEIIGLFCICSGIQTTYNASKRQSRYESNTQSRRMTSTRSEPQSRPTPPTPQLRPKPQPRLQPQPYSSIQPRKTRTMRGSKKILESLYTEGFVSQQKYEEMMALEAERKYQEFFDGVKQLEDDRVRALRYAAGETRIEPRDGMTCPQCGEIVSKGEPFCYRCGKNFGEN